MVLSDTNLTPLHLAPEASDLSMLLEVKCPTTEEDSGLTARKLRSVIYGRLRFAGKW